MILLIENYVKNYLSQPPKEILFKYYNNKLIFEKLQGTIFNCLF